MTSRTGPVGVVIPYFNGRERLRTILSALDDQVGVDLEIVVADDGSTLAPDIGERSHVSVVRQEDRGVRPAAARNLGAESLSAGCTEICFLDGDTIPRPNYVATLVEPLRCSRADVVVGRREYADLDGLDHAATLAWTRSPTEDRRLPQPAWLEDGYRRTDSLRAGTPDLFRYVISATMAMSRVMFDRVGGFDGDIDVYGGEDWELAARCWCSGARFEYVDAAVAVHDGPDFGARSADCDVKTRETACIAQRITDPTARGRGLIRRRPAGVIDLIVADELAPTFASIETLLSGSERDLAIGLVGDDDIVTELLRWTSPDPRVTRGPVSDHPAHRWRSLLTAPALVDAHTVDTVTRPVSEARVAGRRVRFDGGQWLVWSRRCAWLDHRNPTRPPPQLPTTDGGDVGLRRSVVHDLEAFFGRDRRAT